MEAFPRNVDRGLALPSLRARSAEDVCQPGKAEGRRSAHHQREAGGRNLIAAAAEPEYAGAQRRRRRLRGVARMAPDILDVMAMTFNNPALGVAAPAGPPLTMVPISAGSIPDPGPDFPAPEFELFSG